MGTADLSRNDRSGRPRWAWLLFPQLGLVIVATVMASFGWIRTELFQDGGLDKVGHFVAYGALAFFAVGFFHRARWWRTALVLGAVAALEELSQRLVPGRTFDLGDLAATLAGIGLCGLLAARARARRSGRTKKRYGAAAVALSADTPT